MSKPIDQLVVRAKGQCGPLLKDPPSVRLFLDDLRNPPLKEKGWVVVRTVADGIWFMYEHGHLVTEVSLDNDLGQDPQGIALLNWILTAHETKAVYFPQLRQFTIHTGNMPQWRKMVRLLRGKGYITKRRVPHHRIYPQAKDDPRTVKVYTHV